MKREFFHIIAATVIAVAAFGACTVTGTLYDEFKETLPVEPPAPEYKTITMTTNKSGVVRFELSGYGIVIIDWGDGTEVETYYIYNNKIYEHDYSSANTRTITVKCENVTSLNCVGNEIMNLNVSDNGELNELYCANNLLESLNLENNTALTYLDCSVNKLEQLDVSSNTEITVLFCNDNQLEDLSVLNNTKLIIVNCSINLLNADALNVLLESLHDNDISEKGKVLFIDGNPGLEDYDDSYWETANEKGWYYQL